MFKVAMAHSMTMNFSTFLTRDLCLKKRWSLFVTFSCHFILQYYFYLKQGRNLGSFFGCPQRQNTIKTGLDLPLIFIKRQIFFNGVICLAICKTYFSSFFISQFILLKNSIQISYQFPFFFIWDSLHARLNSHYEAWS